MDLVMEDQVKLDNEAKARLERCVPIAKKLLGVFHAHLDEITMGDNDATNKSVTPVAEEILALFLKENIHWTDRQFIFQLATQPIEFVLSAVQNSSEISFDKAARKLWGKDILDLTFVDIHTVLIQDSESE